MMLGAVLGWRGASNNTDLAAEVAACYRACAIPFGGISLRYIMEWSIMTAVAKRKTSLTLDAAALDSAKELEINVSAVAEAALVKAIAEARQQRWLEENADAFAAQASWHEQNGHPLAEIISGPGGSSWTS